MSRKRPIFEEKCIVPAKLHVVRPMGVVTLHYNASAGVPSLTYPPPSSIPPGIINLGPTYRGYIQPRFNIPPRIYGT